MRRSSRLQISGYYDSEGNPVISYKEILYRVFKRRRFFPRRKLSASDMDQKINDSMNGVSQRSLWWIIFILLCIGLAFFLPSWTGSSLDPGHYVALCLSRVLASIRALMDGSPDHSVTESPITEIKGPPEPCRHIEESSSEMEDELLTLRRRLTTLFPLADSLSNFALKSLGARIVYSLTSKAYQTPQPRLTFFGIPLWRSAVNPSVVIEGHSPLLPGRCWPFPGDQGHLVIALPFPVVISHVSLGHISNSSSPSGSIAAAPKVFSIYGMEYLDCEMSLLGTFLYDQDGGQMQTFKIPANKTGTFNYVKLQVESNWGHPNYTCVYNFRVHGRWQNEAGGDTASWG